MESGKKEIKAKHIHQVKLFGVKGKARSLPDAIKE